MLGKVEDSDKVGSVQHLATRLLKSLLYIVGFSSVKKS